MLLKLLSLLGIDLDFTLPKEEETFAPFDYNEYGDYLYPSFSAMYLHDDFDKAYDLMVEADEYKAHMETLHPNRKETLHV